MCALIISQGATHCVPNIKAPPCHAIMSILPPLDIAVELVAEVHSLVGDEAFGEAECHGCVIGPFTGFEVERATADDVSEWGERAPAGELNGRAKSVSSGEAEEGASAFILDGCHDVRWLEFKINTLLNKLLVMLLIEPVESGGSVGDVLLDFVGFDEDSQLDDFFTEVPFVDWRLQYNFVELLKLSEGEFFREEFKSDRLIPHLAFESGQSCFEDRLVVECQTWQVVETEPGGISGIGRCFGCVVDEVDQCVVSDGDNVFARVAVRCSKAVELFKKNVTQTRLLFEFATSTGIDGFSHSDKSAWQCPVSLKGLDVSLDQENFQVLFI